MAHLQVRDIDEKLYSALRTLASNEKRSVTQEVIYILQKYLSAPKSFDQNPTEAFLQLSGSWADNKNAEEIINDIKSNHVNSSRFGKDNDLFD
ncbi:MAG: antitoxin [Deltaproteobacteria bacterium]|nr:antitoxin [Deltaproteobacteria bacterium]